VLQVRAGGPHLSRLPGERGRGRRRVRRRRRRVRRQQLRGVLPLRQGRAHRALVPRRAGRRRPGRQLGRVRRAGRRGGRRRRGRRQQDVLHVRRRGPPEPRLCAGEQVLQLLWLRESPCGGRRGGLRTDGLQGHISRDCPEPQKRACYTCGSEGFVAFACVSSVYTSLSTPAATSPATARASATLRPPSEAEVPRAWPKWRCSDLLAFPPCLYPVHGPCCPVRSRSTSICTLS
jgi:hypothetical protein